MDQRKAMRIRQIEADVRAKADEDLAKYTGHSPSFYESCMRYRSTELLYEAVYRIEQLEAKLAALLAKDSDDG